MTRKMTQPNTTMLITAYGASYLLLLGYLLIQSSLFMPTFWMYLGASEAARRVLEPSELND